MSYTVCSGCTSFGVRLALGASARDLLRLTLTEAGVLTGLGVTIGFVLAVVLGRALSSALFGLISLEPMTFLIVAAGLAVVHRRRVHPGTPGAEAGSVDDSAWAVVEWSAMRSDIQYALRSIAKKPLSSRS